LHASGQTRLGSELNASLVGIIRRPDGSSQVTYSGHPLYLYFGDANPGDTMGQGVNAFGANWYVLSPSGSEITAATPASGGGSGSY
jgi:hypothetical protein